MTLLKDFEDFIILLNKYRVEYMVVGGYALAFHGKPRYTGDIDIWINVSEENAIKLVSVIAAFGFRSLGFTKEDFMEEGLINQIGRPPLRIDILSSIDGVRFGEAIKEVKEINVGGVNIPYIGLGDLIKNKTASGRTKDIADIEMLRTINPKQKKK